MAASSRDAGKVVDRWDDVFRAVASEPRRQLIVALLDESPDDTVALPASAANPRLPDDPDSLRALLYHHHLPLLADLEFVAWDVDPLVASRGPRFEEVAVVFEALHDWAADVPDSLALGCQRLEAERRADP
ncbi:hypothetical protein [Halobacterium yunchengense]|uniref:hypothetical protein n=1 Tax=Halobacterium yunchengense TaxID=3108497 RepID=UPI00300BA7D7